MRILRVDMKTKVTHFEDVPDKYEKYAGRALIARLLLEEVPADCEPLGPHNKLIFTPGLLGGAGVTTAGRLSVGAKSPLTRGVKEANAGGTAGDTLGRMGIKAIVVENQPSTVEFFVLHVYEDRSELAGAEEVTGLGNYTTAENLKRKHGEDTTVISIGQAGEYLLRAAGIACTGSKDQKSNHAARGGLGAVMGSKGLKAIVIHKPAIKQIEYADHDLFRKSARAFSQELINNPKLGPQGGQHLYGTASIVGAVNDMGSLPTQNFSRGDFEASTNLSGAVMRETILARQGKIGTRCMPGCVIACRNSYVDKCGKEIVGTLQYETIALVGANLGINNLDDVAIINYMCNDFGLDTIETGAALGVAMEAGLVKPGDTEGFMGLLQHIADGTMLGRVIGNGAVTTGNMLGIQRVPAALGQAMPGYDPRSLKGNGVTYATSPQGADHTAGNAFGARKEVNPLGIEGQKELSLKLQIIAAMLDSTGLCLFARPPVIADPQLMVDMLNGIYGWNWTKDDLDQYSRNILRDELEFNRRAGITKNDYRIPKYMHEEPLAPHNAVFDVPDEDLDTIFENL